jgi:hypothetical protein
MAYQLWISPITGQRRQGTRFSSLKKIFVDNVTAKSIYEPLLCCPAESLAVSAKKALKNRGFDVAGAKEAEGGKVIGYVLTDELDSGPLRDYVNVFDSDCLISDSTPIADIFSALTKRDFVFVLYGKLILGIITKADINKPPVRIYLFGMISLFEMHMNLWINHFYPNYNWMHEISESRLESARNVYELRRGENQDLSLLECIQFCDKRDLLRKSNEFINDFDFSRNGFDKIAKRIEKIRNELAHSQNSIISKTEWSVFVETVNRLEVFLVQSDSKVEYIATKGSDFTDSLVTSALA